MKYTFLFAKLALFQIYSNLYLNLSLNLHIQVIVEEVNGEIFLKFRRTSIVSQAESIYSLRNSLVHCIKKKISKYFGLNERSDNYFHNPSRYTKTNGKHYLKHYLNFLKYLQKYIFICNLIL